MTDSVSRKGFVSLIGSAGIAAAVTAAPEAAVAGVTTPAMPPAHHAGAKPASHTMPIAPLGSTPEAYSFFNEDEAAFVEAAVERLIPADHLSPSAKDAGVAFYIDQQLAGGYGSAARMYTHGPWLPGTPQQGYQLRQTPAEAYRLGILETNAYCQKNYGKTFDKLDAAHRDDVLTGLDTGKIVFESIPSDVFFNFLYGNTVEGFFADPLYGGNRDKVGWRMIGFPGVAANYQDHIGKHNVPYRVAPVSIADVQQGKPVAEGHMLMHEMALENIKKLKEGR